MNPDTKTTEYLVSLAAIKLSDSSRARLQNNLLDYARFHAVPTIETQSVRVVGDSRSIWQVPPRTSFLTQIINLHSKSMTAALIAIMLLVGGGTSYAAESSVPGEMLYPIKVDVNENVQSALAFSDTAEANLQVHLAEKRLQEAETLAARGKLTAVAASDLDTRLKAHYESAESLSTKVEAKGDYKSSATVRASLEGELHTHAQILSDLNTRIAGNSGSALITHIGLYAGTAAQLQAEATATVKTSVDAKAMTEASLAAGDAMILKVQTFLTNSENKLSANIAAGAKVKLAKAISLEATAKASFGTSAYADAYAASQSAIRTAAEVSALIESTLRLGAAATINIGDVNDTTIDLHDGSDDNMKTGKTSTTTPSAETDASTTDDATTAKKDLEMKAGVHTDETFKTGVHDTTVKSDTSVDTGVSL